MEICLDSTRPRDWHFASANVERKPKRIDQCAFGAVDEKRTPVLKATGLEAYNLRLKMVLKRCNGHHGTAHASLQGQHLGMNRTAMAAVCACVKLYYKISCIICSPKVFFEHVIMTHG